MNLWFMTEWKEACMRSEPGFSCGSVSISFFVLEQGYLALWIMERVTG